MKRYLLIAGLVLGLVLIVAACTPAAAPTPCPEAAPCPAVEPAQPAAAAIDAPFAAAWEASGHNKKDSAAFTHWNEETPAEVPVTCAKCHSGTGFADFVGADGSAAGAVDKAQPVGNTITCTACHNEATANLTSVKFPSGVEVTGLGSEAVCMTCHQGMASMVQVDEAIAKGAPADDDTVIKDQGFVGNHYFAAATTLYGGTTKGGYQYTDKMYDSKNDHVEGYDTCVACHDTHSLEVKVSQCTVCHSDVKAVEDLKNVREPSSGPDYDGDGDVKEGMYYEIEGLQAVLYSAIQAYGKDVVKTPIVYSAEAYPYFFIDTNADGKVDEAEAVFPNAYASWTARLMKAAYNYQTSIKDPGAFAHGNKYIVQLLVDSIEDLNTKLPTPVDTSKLHRDDNGHFAGNSEAFRHWDAEGEVPGSCAKCHAAGGLPQFIKNNANVAMEASNGFACSTCHNEAEWPAVYGLADVTFPSGAKLTFGDKAPANVCLACHQGRESSVSVNKAIAGLDVDKSSDKLGFRNVHYFAAGSTLFGTEAKGVYEYEGQKYNGRFPHTDGFATCTDCHDKHMLKANTAACEGCHKTADPEAIRMVTTDFDGDKDVAEGIAGEISTMQEKLYAAIQTYATTKLSAGIVYSASVYPYFMLDKDGNGEPDKNDKGGNLAYNAWSPRLLKAAYNYQYSIKDPGAFVHNGSYIMQVLYDSIKDLGGDVAGMTRPPVK